jgi:ribosomal protein S13
MSYYFGNIFIENKKKKNFHLSLTEVFGIGRIRAKKIADQFYIKNDEKRIENFEDEERRLKPVSLLVFKSFLIDSN